MPEKTVLTKIPSQFISRPFVGEKGSGAAGINLRHLTSMCLGICLAVFWSAATSAQTFTIQDAKTELVDKVYRLDANLKYRFSPQALDALENGVTLILALDIEVIKPRRYMWDEEIANLEQRYEIRYLALTDQYLLNNKNSGSQFAYSTLGEALATLEKIANEIIDQHPEIKHWVIGGHSIGGVMAAQYTDKNPEMIEGLAFWASYPANSTDISDLNIPVVSVYGSREVTVTVASVGERAHLLPEDTVYIRIEGGDHHQFGSYEINPKDHLATTSRVSQHQQIIEVTLAMLSEVSK